MNCSVIYCKHSCPTLRQTSYTANEPLYQKLLSICESKSHTDELSLTGISFSWMTKTKEIAYLFGRLADACLLNCSLFNAWHWCVPGSRTDVLMSVGMEINDRILTSWCQVPIRSCLSHSDLGGDAALFLPVLRCVILGLQWLI